MKERAAAVFTTVFGVAILAIAFIGLGMMFQKHQFWPYQQIKETAFIVKSLIQNGEVIGEGRQFPAVAGSSREPVVIHDPEGAIGEGYYAFLAWDGPNRTYGVFLYDADGTLLHKWPVDETEFFEGATHNSNAPHAMEVMRDGTVLISFDWLGVMARLDACGDAIWTREGFFHHAFSPAADGGIWTWSGQNRSYGQIQDIVKFDSDTGQDIVRLNFNDDVIMHSPETAITFSMRPGFTFVPDKDEPADILHPNDVEELTPEMADAFPAFEAGDLLLSIRELDLIMVVDPSDGDTKWSQRGPWLRQHDPDFSPDGTITVFNNARGRPNSSIYSIDPETRAVRDLFPELTFPFKSGYRGKQQRLPNGNYLITIPEQGQVIEVAEPGKLLVEFNNIADGKPDHNEDIANAKWLPPGYFETMPACRE